MSRIGHRAEMARLPEHEGIKQALRSAERLRAVGVSLHHANRWWKTGYDSWAAHIDESPGFPDGNDPDR